MSSLALDDAVCPAWTPFWGFLGICCGVVLACAGSAIGTAKCGIGLCSAAALNKSVIVRGLIAPIMAGIIGIYGLVAAVIINPKIVDEAGDDGFHLFDGYALLAAGLSVGLCGLASGMCIGVAGDAAARVMAEKPQLLMGCMLVLIFGEVLGLYGFIIAIILSGKSALPCGSRA